MSMSNDQHMPAAMGHFLSEFWQALAGDPEQLLRLRISAQGSLPSVFAVTDFAAAAVGVAHLAVSELLQKVSGTAPQVVVDRRLASLWFASSLRPQGWALLAQWDAVAGDYQTADGWIRLHTNAPHHRDAALAVLGTRADRDAVAKAVGRWQASALESAIVERQGCAAAMRTAQQWAVHPQGMSVNAEPLLHRQRGPQGAPATWAGSVERPLHGIRVLDLTRILAGPVATRFLAGFGAQVLRIDPYGWEEPGTVPEVVLGKRCARLDLRAPADRRTFEQLLSQADVLIHGYRADALAHLGLGVERRRELNPGLVDISLDAYGWTGPWRERRGFDSLVQMSSGIADAGMRASGSDKPVPLPVQALDHATGYLMAAAAVSGLSQRLVSGHGSQMQASLARSARLLMQCPVDSPAAHPLTPVHSADFAPHIEHSAWGPAQRLKPAGQVQGAPTRWDLAACALGSSEARWL
jgi:hypothetical protein